MLRVRETPRRVWDLFPCVPLYRFFSSRQHKSHTIRQTAHPANSIGRSYRLPRHTIPRPRRQDNYSYPPRCGDSPASYRPCRPDSFLIHHTARSHSLRSCHIPSSPVTTHTRVSPSARFRHHAYRSVTIHPRPYAPRLQRPYRNPAGHPAYSSVTFYPHQSAPQPHGLKPSCESFAFASTPGVPRGCRG
jgi:hypothetical protein